jgi:hypothetical protein
MNWEKAAMDVRIYKPVRTATQQGRAGAGKWLVEFAPAAPKERDPLMGWTGSVDMLGQVRLRFDSKEDAVAYAERRGYRYSVRDPEVPKIRIKSYADNFRYAKVR